MGKVRGLIPAAVEIRAGYSSGDKLVSELSPPPRGPAPGEKPKAQPVKRPAKSDKK